jgi:bacteriocin-like protein
MNDRQGDATVLSKDELAAVTGGTIEIPEMTISASGPMSVSLKMGGSTMTIWATASSHGITWS